MTGNNLYGALAYNQEKVDNGVGSVLATHKLPEPADGNFNVAKAVADFKCWMPEDFRTEKPVIHISLNPDPKDNLSDDQLTEIAAKYMDRMGWGGQPYMVFKHADIDRKHIHIVSIQVRRDGRKIKDGKRNERSVAITEELEREYGLHSGKGQKRSELWQFKPVDPAAGDLKKQMVAVIKPAASMYSYQTLGEFRTLLSLYNIGIEEVRGVRGGQHYRGLLYTVLDGDGAKSETPPLKSSVFGKSVGWDALEKHMERSSAKIEKEKIRDHTRRRVAEAMLDASEEARLRERLRAARIDLYLRRNATGRITGVTFIDHENRCVLSGSRLGKEFSANALNERFADFSMIENRCEDLQPVPLTPTKEIQQPAMQTISDNRRPSTSPTTPDQSSVADAIGSLFSILTPEHGGQSNDSQPKRIHPKEKKSKQGPSW